MTAKYCHFCECWFFVSGQPCKTEQQRDRCLEYASIQEAKRLNDSALSSTNREAPKS